MSGKSTLPKRIKKPIISGEIKKSAPQLRQSKEPDKYREPVE